MSTCILHITAVLKREARRAWNGRDGVRWSAGRLTEWRLLCVLLRTLAIPLMMMLPLLATTPWATAMELADRNGSVHQPLSGTADGTAF